MEKILSKKVLLICGILIVGFTVIAYIYFQVLKPISLDVSMLESEVQIEEKRLSLLHNQQTENEQPSTSTVELQRKIPVLPLQEQFILQLETAAVASKIEIFGMNFSNAEYVEPMIENADQNEEGRDDVSHFPDGIEMLTASLSLSAPTYAAIETFLMELETLQRIIKIDHLSIFAVTGTVITLNMNVSAFYLPTLSDLQDEVPTIDIPAPANKKNPFE